MTRLTLLISLGLQTFDTTASFIARLSTEMSQANQVYSEGIRNVIVICYLYNTTSNPQQRNRSVFDIQLLTEYDLKFESALHVASSISQLL